MMLHERDDLVNGLQLHSYAAGDSSAPALVFLHGFPEWGGAWERQLDFFAAQGFYAIAPDQRGYNRSDKPRSIRSYTVQLLAADIAALIEVLQLKDVTLCGHDWGGAVAWELARTRPDLVQRLVILNMPHPAAMRQALRYDRGQLRRSWYAGFFQLPLLPEVLCAAFGFALLKRTLRRTARKGTFSEEELHRYIDAWKQPGALRAMLNWYRAFRFTPATDFTIDMPALVLWGRRDAFLKASLAPASLAHCTNGRLLWFDKATHWLHHEEPDGVNEAIQNFINRNA
ncbi:MAG: alpha/beta hydrolase [Sphingobacteriales bacterium]|nr:MAG: alpha/beta hydrolase [Sphingobacteriales bacterium]